MNGSRFQHFGPSSPFRPVDRSKNSLNYSSQDFSSLPYLSSADSRSTLSSQPDNRLSNLSGQTDNRLSGPTDNRLSSLSTDKRTFSDSRHSSQSSSSEVQSFSHLRTEFQCLSGKDVAGGGDFRSLTSIQSEPRSFNSVSSSQPEPRSFYVSQSEPRSLCISQSDFRTGPRGAVDLRPASYSSQVEKRLYISPAVISTSSASSAQLWSSSSNNNNNNSSSKEHGQANTTKIMCNTEEVEVVEEEDVFSAEGSLCKSLCMDVSLVNVENENFSPSSDYASVSSGERSVNLDYGEVTGGSYDDDFMSLQQTTFNSTRSTPPSQPEISRTKMSPISQFTSKTMLRTTTTSQTSPTTAATSIPHKKTVELENYAKQYEAFHINRTIRSSSRERAKARTPSSSSSLPTHTWTPSSTSTQAWTSASASTQSWTPSSASTNSWTPSSAHAQSKYVLSVGSYTTLPRKSASSVKKKSEDNPAVTDDIATNGRDRGQNRKFNPDSCQYTRSLPRPSKVIRDGWVNRHSGRGIEKTSFYIGEGRRSSVDKLIETFESKTELDKGSRPSRLPVKKTGVKPSEVSGPPGLPPKPPAAKEEDNLQKEPPEVEVKECVCQIKIKPTVEPERLERDVQQRLAGINTFIINSNEPGNPDGSGSCRKVPPAVAPKPAKRPGAAGPPPPAPAGSASTRSPAAPPPSVQISTLRWMEGWKETDAEEELEEEEEQSVGDHHQHSNSDSGMSSMYGSVRTALISPVSILSSTSSRSSQSSNRSESNVSFTTVDEAIKEFDSSRSSSSRPIHQVSSSAIPETSCDGKENYYLRALNYSCEPVSSSSSSPLTPTAASAAVNPYAAAASTAVSSPYVTAINPTSIAAFGHTTSSAPTVHPSVASVNPYLMAAVKPKSAAGVQLTNSSRSSLTGPARSVTFPWVEEKINEFLGSEDTSSSSSPEAGIQRVKNKVVHLETSLQQLREENEQHNAYFARLESRLLKSATFHELEKYKLHISEIDKITALLAGLQLRKAKLWRSFQRERDYFEKQLLEGKRESVEQRIAEAEILHGNIERRSASIKDYMKNYLGDAELENYTAALDTKVAVVKQIKSLENEVNLGKEILVLVTNLGTCNI